jgi:hypothetical protein
MTIVETVCPERKNLFSDISLSARTVTRRIEDMSQNLDNQLSKISQTFTAYSLALDESLDCTDISQLSVFIRGTNETFEIYEELLKVVSIHNTTKGIDIFNELIDLLTINKIDLTKLVSITTDGAPSMVGKYNGLVAHMSNKLKEVCDQKLINYHCIIHQEALCSKSAELSNVMRIVIETVNKIRANPLSHRQFRELLEEIDAEYGDLIFYSHVRWLSRGKVLMRFFKLREEIDLFLITKDKQVKELSDPKFNFDLAFMVDLTAYLNELNLKLQGESQLVVEMFNQIKTFEIKLDLWKRQLLENNLYHFNTCQEIKQIYENEIFEVDTYVGILESLKQQFQERFNDFRSHKFEFDLFNKPFDIEVYDSPEDIQMELIELQANDELKSKFKSLKLIEFYEFLSKSHSNAFSKIKTNALRIASMFGSTYLCEQLFSILKHVKSNTRNRMNDEHLNACLKIQSSKQLKPNIDLIISNKQLRVSNNANK